MLKLHECTHAAQLFFNSARVGRDNVEVGQRNRDLTAPNFEITHHFKSGSSCRLIWGNTLLAFGVEPPNEPGKLNLQPRHVGSLIRQHGLVVQVFTQVFDTCPTSQRLRSISQKHSNDQSIALPISADRFIQRVIFPGFHSQF